jgi:hypothetical protein
VGADEACGFDPVHPRRSSSDGGRRRRSRARRDALLVPFERGQREEPKGGGAASIGSPERGRRRGAAAAHGELRGGGEPERKGEGEEVLEDQRLTLSVEEATARSGKHGAAGIVGGGRRPELGKKRSGRSIPGVPGRFLRRDDGVEDGGAPRRLGLARGGLKQRGRRRVLRLGFGLDAEERERARR